MLCKKRIYIVAISLFILTVLVIPVFAQESATVTNEVGVASFKVPIIVDGQKYQPVDFERTFGKDAVLHYYISSSENVIYAFTTEEGRENYLNSIQEGTINQQPIARPYGFTVFYADYNWSGFAAHVYNGQRLCYLGSLDNVASSLWSYTDKVTLLWQNPGCQGSSVAIGPYSQLSSLGFSANGVWWDNQVSGVEIRN